MRTTLDLDDKVLAAARALARDTKVTLGEAISELARRGLRSARVPLHRDAFPIFAVPEQAPPLTLDQVNEYRDDV
ncbi:MAG: antitoxin [Geodermatophilaceae bacterium]